MSRLDSMLRRLTAQRDGLNWAAAAIAEVEGDVLDLGLGNGRTYDHLREALPNRRVWVIDRVLQCHPSCVPPEENFLQGEAGPMLARLAGTRALRLSLAALERLSQHDFPGNIRELRNLLERALLLTDGDEISAETLDAALALEGPATGSAPSRRRVGDLAALSTDQLRRHAAAHQGSRRDLAKQLGISERSLYRRLRSLASDIGSDEAVP